MTRAVTVRLRPDIFERSHDLAQARRISLNAFVQESLERAIAEAEEKALYDAFTEAGRDAEESSVEYAREAQWEVIRHDG